MMKTVYIIPGYKHTLETPGYKEIIEGLENKGMKAVFIQIHWNYKVMSDYIEEASLKIGDTHNSGIIGFSFGAMIALKLSMKNKFDMVVLCSLSPYFSEDLNNHPVHYKRSLGVKRWKDFEDNYSEKSIKNSQNNSYSLIYGDDETQGIISRAQKTISQLSIKQVIVLKGVGHDIGDKKYLDAINKII